jgi:hypothetical protein
MERARKAFGDSPRCGNDFVNRELPAVDKSTDALSANLYGLGDLVGLNPEHCPTKIWVVRYQSLVERYPTAAETLA